MADTLITDCRHDSLPWLPMAELRNGTVVSRLQFDDLASARRAFNALAPDADAGDFIAQSCWLPPSRSEPGLRRNRAKAHPEPFASAAVGQGAGLIGVEPFAFASSPAQITTNFDGSTCWRKAVFTSSSVAVRMR